MSERLTRWESDPLFPAAEVVQDSADRMESVYRLLLHELSLVQGGTIDTKVPTSTDYHKRDLMTALETTKWQLEDFERAVYFSALSDKTHQRENAISKHTQFIRAIREQIVAVEKSLEDLSFGDSMKNVQMTNLGESDTDGLAFFLSGGDSMDHREHYDSENNIMERFLDSTANTDEIVEIKPEEFEHLQLNDTRHSDPVFERNFGSHYSKRSGVEPLVIHQVKECEGADNCGAFSVEVDNSNMKCFPSKNWLRGFMLGSLSHISFANKCRMTQSFTKRKKDGELLDDFMVDIEGRQLPSFLKITPGGQIYRWLEALQRRSRRFQYIFRYNQFSLWLALAILVTLVILGILGFLIA